MTLTVIAGPANSGKSPLMRSLLRREPTSVSVHRDEIRQAIGGAKIDEGQLTLATTAMAEALLNTGLDVIACGWNTHPEDRKRWERVAKRTEHRLVWLDTRDRAVHSLIPPLEGWTPISYESAA